jgi:hypothetical protein
MSDTDTAILDEFEFDDEASDPTPFAGEGNARFDDDEDEPEDAASVSAAGGEDATAEGDPPAAPIVPPAAALAAGEVKAATEAPVEPDAETTQKVTAFDAFSTALRQDPAGVVETILDSMTPLERSNLVGQYNKDAIAPFNLEEYEAQDEMEEALAARWNHIEAIPHLAQDLDGLKGQMQALPQAIAGTLNPQVFEANFYAQTALEKIDAICEVLGISLPDPDPATVEKLNDGKATYRDIVRKASDYKSVVAGKKQAQVRRPETPGNQARRPETIQPGTDMETIARRLGYIKR